MTFDEIRVGQIVQCNGVPPEFARSLRYGARYKVLVKVTNANTELGHETGIIISSAITPFGSLRYGKPIIMPPALFDLVSQS